MSFAAKRKKEKKSSNRIQDKQVPHTLLQKLSPKSLTSPLSITSQIFTKMVLIIAITITILGSMLSIIRPERKSVLGISSCSSRSSEFAKSRAHNCCHGYAEPEFTRDILAGKRSHAYIFPSADFWASCLYYFNIYIVNLESDHSFTIFCELIYLYISNVYRSWASCNWATYPEVISVDICTLVYFSSNLISLLIKSHDKYQSFILIGLARAEKANSRNWSILVHYRSYQKELRPLVTH